MTTPNPTILILIILSLFASSQSIIATTLVVINQATKPGKIAYVICHVHSTDFEVDVAPGNKTSLVLPRNFNSTSWPAVQCEGEYSRYYTYYHYLGPVLYNSNSDYEKCKNKCFIRATGTGFDRWDDEKKKWKEIPEPCYEC
ncbi:hypothetical protein PTKIN_Ptkin11bG0019300 [Pterospermum kingtungense]